jgi:hypothetical protein
MKLWYLLCDIHQMLTLGLDFEENDGINIDNFVDVSPLFHNENWQAFIEAIQWSAFHDHKTA